MGIGVPPAPTNWTNACTGGMSPTTIATTPRTTRSGGLDPAISHWVINHGPSPANVPGATTKKAADPTAAVDVRTA
jgi:acetate kinase